MRSIIGARCAILILALGGLVSLVLCAYSAGFLSVSADEFAKTVIARQGLSEPSAWFEGVWLPLHLVLIAATSVLTGELLVASRLISIAFGMLLVVALWAIGRQSGGTRGGGLAAILGATHPLVVLLSATAMVNICYVSTFMLGLAFYMRATYAARPRPIDLFVACGLLTLACAFHYNAWIAASLLVPFLLRDLYRAHLPRRVVAAGLVLLGSAPIAWVAWNWAHTGYPLAFFTKHSEYSATFWAHFGWYPSPRAAVKALGHSLRVYSPLVAILAFAGMGTLLRGRSADRRPFLLWSLLVGFLAALVFLYARGGRPAAFEPRYILLPSVLMISIASGALVRLWLTGAREVRAFILLLAISAVVVNVRLYRESIFMTKNLDHYGYTAEARDVAAVMRPYLKARKAPRMLLELKGWNFLAMPVFLNRIDAIVNDRDLIDDSIRHFENPSMLLGPREPVLARLKSLGVGFIAVWSPAVQSRIEPWGLDRLARVDTYTVYRVR